MDDKEYLRTGDVSGHVALEFYDEKTGNYFAVGAVIDAFGDLLPVKTLFYRTFEKSMIRCLFLPKTEFSVQWNSENTIRRLNIF